MRMLRIILWTLGILLLVEAGLEVRAKSRGYNTILFGSVEQARPSLVHGTVQYGPTESFPFRSLVVARERTPGVDRVWLASASYGEDTYVEPDRTFPSLAAAALTGAGHPTEILNASRAGNTIAGNIDFMNEHAAAWSPRAVVLYQMSLDVNLLAERLLGKGGDGAPGVPGGSPAAGPGAEPTPNIFVQWYESTTIYKTLKELVGGRATQERILAKSLGPQAAPLFRQTVLDFVAAARALGIQPVLCTFATSHDAHNLELMSASSRNAVFRFNIYLAMEGWVAAVEELNRVIVSVAADEGLPLIDMGGKLGGNPVYFRDYIHFSPEGHAAMASLLAESLAGGLQAPQ